MAAALGSGDDGLSIDYGSIAESMLADLSPLVSQAVPNGGLDAFNLLSQPQAGTYYISRDFTGTVEVRLSQPADVDSAVYDFLMPEVIDLTPADRRALDAIRRAGFPFRIRNDPDSQRTLVASWTTPGGVVTVSAINVSASTLIELLPSIRLTEPLEWATLLDKSDHGELEIDYPPEGAANNPTLIGRKTGGADQFWAIEMQADPAAISVQSDRTGWAGLIGDIDSAPTVRQFASTTITFLVATAEWPNTARSVRVTVEGQAPVDLPMMQVGDSPVYAAGYAFVEVAPATVEFFDSEGNPVTG
jgi:hypothetical protein